MLLLCLKTVAALLLKCSKPSPRTKSLGLRGSVQATWGGEGRQGGRTASVPTFSGGANVFPTTPQGSTGSAGADVSCPLFPPPSGTKTLGTGREGPMEHLGIDVRGGLSGRQPVWCLSQRIGLSNLLQMAAEREALKILGSAIILHNPCPPVQPSAIVATSAIFDRYPETKA